MSAAWSPNVAYDGCIGRRLRALILARTALAPASGEDEALQEQLISGRAAAARLDADVVGEIKMSGWSGSSTAIGHTLLDELETWGADIVIVAALDRLSRCADQLEWILRELAKRGVTVMSMADNLGILPFDAKRPHRWGEG
jgi:DNA invertase Pin-like site-specific DNA recombinase